LPVERGALVTDVMSGSPADRAEIEKGDIIIGFGDKAINSVDELVKEVQKRKVGEKARLLLLRGDERWMADVTLEQIQ
jgi:S1-C subfamily serine protease